MFEKIKAFKGPFSEFLGRGSNKKTVILIIFAAAVLMLVQMNKGMGGGKSLIMSEDGSVAGLSRASDETASSFPLTVEISRDGEEKEYDIMITLKGETREGSASEAHDVSEGEPDLKDSLDDAVYEIERTGGKSISLPTELEDGTRLKWSRTRDKSPLMILMMAPLLIFLLYRSDRNKEKALIKKKTDDVIRMLPSFNDQLLMMLDCGLVFSDALGRIGDEYEKNADSFFKKLIVGIRKRAESGNRSLVREFGDTAKDVGIREFSRISGIIADNQYKGTDLRSKLEQESGILWNKRKDLAEEKGKIAETKLTYPLAILLIVLVLISAAPAILQVKGG